MAVNVTTRENERCVGLAFVDMTKRQIGMTEFLDDDLYTSLESAMVALSCRECVVPQPTAVKSPDDRKLRDVMARCNVLVTEKKKSDFRYISVLQSTASQTLEETIILCQKCLWECLCVNWLHCISDY